MGDPLIITIIIIIFANLAKGLQLNIRHLNSSVLL